MRLLLVNYEYPPLGGGAGNATAHLAKELARLGIDVIVLTSAFRGLRRAEQSDGFSILRVPVIRRRMDRCTPLEMLTFLASAVGVALGLARRWRPDAVITFFGIPSGPVGLALKLVYGIPYLVSLRGGDVPGFQPYDLSLYHTLTRPVIHWVWRQACGVVANSSGLGTLAQSSAPDVRVEVIPNGVDAGHFCPGLNPPLPGRATRLLFVARLVYQKGLDVLLQAMAQTPNVALEVIGDGEARVELEKLAVSLGLSQRIHFDGWRSRPELPDCYRAADVFVLPSRHEGMPNAILEAMACGLPVIATRISGNEELVRDGETGLLIPPDEPIALAAALSALAADDQLRRHMGRAGRALVESRYTWRRAAEAYLDLIRQL